MIYKIALSLLGSICLAGCSASGEPPVARVLPAEPEFAKPVEVAKPKKGESAVAVAARERAGRIAANGRIVAFREWYESVRENYAK